MLPQIDVNNFHTNDVEWVIIYYLLFKIGIYFYIFSFHFNITFEMFFYVFCHFVISIWVFMFIFNLFKSVL